MKISKINNINIFQNITLLINLIINQKFLIVNYQKITSMMMLNPV